MGTALPLPRDAEAPQTYLSGLPISEQPRLEETVKKLAIALMFAVAVIGGAVSLPAVHDQAANADAGGWIDPLRMMINAKDLPALHYDDYSVVFN